MPDEFQVTDAVRESVQLLLALFGPTGSGKTFSGLLMAAGIAGPDGKVGMLDAEKKRGSLYADDPVIRKAMPGGKYRRVDLRAPYTPARYINGLKSLESDGCTVALIDSTSHEWSGEGGCGDIAAENKLGHLDNWALAKREHKKFMAYCMSSDMHIIFCLRAHEKAKPVKAGERISVDSDERAKKTEYISLGMQPDTEKNLVYECLISFRVEDKTHLATAVKVPGMLAHLFPEPRLLTKQDGEAIRKWNDTGRAMDEYIRLAERARLAAENGLAMYSEFFAGIAAGERIALTKSGDHEHYKLVAANVDAKIASQEAAGFVGVSPGA